MKIKVGGRTLDATGKAYEQVEEEIDVPNDHFERIARSLMGSPVGPSYVIIDAAQFEAIFGKAKT